MELREAIKVLDSDAHARDLDEDIRPYLVEPYRNQRAPFLPREIYDRNLGGILGHSGAKHEERLAAMDKQEIDTAVLYPTSGLGIGRAREPNYNAALCRAYNDFISNYCKASPRLPFTVLRELATMVIGGIPEKFPKLKIGYLEVGCGWIPYWMERMDEEWGKRGKVEAPLCKKKPSEYLTGENIYYGCEPEEKMMGYVVNEIGSKTLMYASDYP